MVNSQIQKLLLLCVLVYWAQCGWNEPNLVIKKPQNQPSLFVDRGNGNRYVFYPNVTKNDTSILSQYCFKKFDVNDKLLNETCIKLKELIYDITATGADNKEGLYVAFSAKRTLRGASCEDNDLSGCIDIFFTESTDDGQTWSKPIQVPRYNINDSKNRKMPIMFRVQETGRLFIFYKIGKDLHSVTRPGGSTLFTNEIETWCCTNSEESPFWANYAFAEERIFLQLISNNEKTNVTTRVISKDNGITWDDAGNLDSPSFFITPNLNRNKFYMAAFKNNVYKIYRLHYKRGFETRGISDFVEKSYIPIAVPIPDDDDDIMLIASNENQDPSTFIYDYDSEDVIDQHTKPPIKPILGSIVENDDKNFRVVMLHLINDDLYLSTCRLEKPRKITKN